MPKFEQSAKKESSKLKKLWLALGATAGLFSAQPSEAADRQIDQIEVVARTPEQIKAAEEARAAGLKRIGEKSPETLEMIKSLQEFNQGDIASLQEAVESENLEEVARIREENPELWKGIEEAMKVSQNTGVSQELPGKDGG